MSISSTSSLVIVPDPQVFSHVQPGGMAPQYVLVVDDRPEALVVQQQTGPSGFVVVLNQGPRGVQGDIGPVGPSAYELAVEEGFAGTLQEWLDTLRGFILLAPGVDTPPDGTPDGTFVFQQV